jgi:hypothetical protein
MRTDSEAFELCGPAGDVVMIALKTHFAKQYHDINARLRKEFKPKTAHFWVQKMAEIVNQML